MTATTPLPEAPAGLPAPESADALAERTDIEAPEAMAARLSRIDAAGPWSDTDTMRFAIRERDAQIRRALLAEADRQEGAARRWRLRGSERAEADCLVRVSALLAFAARLGREPTR